MNQSDAFHNSASPQESSGSLLPHSAHSSAPKSPGSLAIQLHAIDSSIQTGPTDIPQGELHSLAHCSHLSYTWTCLFCTSSFKYFWLAQMTWCWISSHKTHASDAGSLARKHMPQMPGCFNVVGKCLLIFWVHCSVMHALQATYSDSFIQLI